MISDHHLLPATAESTSASTIIEIEDMSSLGRGSGTGSSSTRLSRWLSSCLGDILFSFFLCCDQPQVPKLGGKSSIVSPLLLEPCSCVYLTTTRSLDLRPFGTFVFFPSRGAPATPRRPSCYLLNVITTQSYGRPAAQGSRVV